METSRSDTGELEAFHFPAIRLTLGAIRVEGGVHVGVARCSMSDEWDTDRGFDVAVGRARHQHRGAGIFRATLPTSSVQKTLEVLDALDSACERVANNYSGGLILAIHWLALQGISLPRSIQSLLDAHYLTLSIWDDEAFQLLIDAERVAKKVEESELASSL